MFPSLRPAVEGLRRSRRSTEFATGRIRRGGHDMKVSWERDLLLSRATHPSSMKHITVAGLLLLSAVFSSAAQAPDTKSDSQERLLALVKEIQTQQSQILANQAKIDSKLVEVAESVRVARIFSSRSR